MPESLRLKVFEQTALREKAARLNHELVAIGEEPMRDSDLLHHLIDIALQAVAVSPEGKILIDISAINPENIVRY